MSSLSSLFGKTLLGAGISRERQDGLSHLRYTLETMPGSKDYVFHPWHTRAEVLSVLYDAFWGSSSKYLIGGGGQLPPAALLSEVQQSSTTHQADGIAAGPSRACSKILQKGECCYRCKDCAIDDNFVLCAKCFHATDHTGHTVAFYLVQQPGECCHCGDPEAWRVPLDCRFHPPLPAGPPPLAARAINPWDVKPSLRTQVPSELRDSMTRTIAYALDFVIDTLDFSPDETLFPESEADLRLQPTAEPVNKELYMVQVWADEKHSFDEIQQIVVEATGCTAEEASQIAERVESQGREVVERSSNIRRLLDVAHVIANIDMGVTIRRAYDTFREQVAAVIIEWLLDLMTCRVSGDAMIIREIVACELLMPRKKDSSSLATNQEASKVYTEIKDPARIDWLFLYHTRLWKRPRLHLKQLYTYILTISQDHKLALADHFANVYHRLIDAYLLTDRDAETSIKFFALQVFTVPSIAAHCVRQHNIIARILATITSFFTNQISHKRITYPPDLSVDVDVDSMPFRSKRFMPIFSDLRHLCSSALVQRMITSRPEFIAHFAKVCRLFVGINANKRAEAHHVEYETDAWISVFNVTLSLSRVVKVYGEAYSRATTTDLAVAMTAVVQEIIASCEHQSADNSPQERERTPVMIFHDVRFAGSDYRVVDFDVLSGWVSFHHALHWLLAELLKHVDLLSYDKLQGAGLQGLRDIVCLRRGDAGFLAVLDQPLRVIVMIAQIRTGLWVRNGFAIRGQLLHYRELMLRELCYDQDLFILQAAFVILDPNLVFVSMMDRFQLVDWFSGAVGHPSYEGTHLLAMVEEFLYVLTACIGESGSASKLPMQEAVRREILHALAAGPTTFTDLCKRVPERMVDDVCFEKVLLQVSTFKAPDGVNDSGVYELKDEAYDEVNPFFYHYSRNKREEVESILKQRLRKRMDVDDPVIVPKPLNIPGGPFVTLPWVMTSEVYIQILFYSVYNTWVQTTEAGALPPSADAILDQSLYLIMLGLVQHPGDFARHASTCIFTRNFSLWHVLAELEEDALFKSHRPQVRWSLDACGVLLPADVQVKRREAAQAHAKTRDDAEAAKKRAAKARQDAIMKQFAAAQKSFMANFEGEDDEDDNIDQATEKPESVGVCIVCQEDLDNTRPFAALAFIQASKFLRRRPDAGGQMLSNFVLSPVPLSRHSPTKASSSFPPSEPFTGSEPSLTFNGFPPQHTKFGLFGSQCGHMMHLECFAVYASSLRQRHRSQAQRNHPENIQRKEFICPLCKSLGNAVLPVHLPVKTPPITQSFPDWIRASSIALLRSPPERLLESLQYKTGSGEFVFWAAQDTGYPPFPKHESIAENPDPVHKMVDTMMTICRMLSSQSRHLRERLEPDPGDRGAGLYLPEDLVNYTISCMEVSLRGSSGNVLDNVSETSLGHIRGLIAALHKLASLQFRDRADSGNSAIRQAIIKRLLPEWRRESAVQLPLLLRDPFTILVETAVVAPEMLRYVTILCYYACLARTTLRLISHLSKPSSLDLGVDATDIPTLFGDLRTFVMSVARHSPALDHTAQLVLNSMGIEDVGKFIYAHSLPFLRRAVLLTRAVCPTTLIPSATPQTSEYRKFMEMLGIPPPSMLASQEALQNVISGWCAHYGSLYSPQPLEFTIPLEYPGPYNLIQLPPALDTLFVQEKTIICPRCRTAPQDAAICLLCGTVCCFQSHCCKDSESLTDRGECNMHMRDCGGVIGIYFLVKRCALLYLYANNGSFAQSPYLDVHGEVDWSMRRGRRQYLHPARMDEVRKLWLTHGIPTLVARKLDSMIDSGGWETL